MKNKTPLAIAISLVATVFASLFSLAYASVSFDKGLMGENTAILITLLGSFSCLGATFALLYMAIDLRTRD